MNHIKLFEDFKQNNITVNDIVKCIDGGGVIYATIIKDFKDNDPKESLIPVSVDDDGTVTINHEGTNYEVELKHVDKIEY